MSIHKNKFLIYSKKFLALFFIKIINLFTQKYITFIEVTLQNKRKNILL